MNYSKHRIDKMMLDNNGTLDISKTKITHLPNGLEVRGDLILNRYIKKLPDKLIVEGNLDLRDTLVDLQYTSRLQVGGNLYTGSCTTGFRWLADIGGDLDLRASKDFTCIDSGCLVVRGNLYLDGNNKCITSIRQTIGVEGDLILKGSCVESFSYGRLVHAKNVDLSYSAIKELPDEFVVYGNLNVSHTALVEYPEKMVVFGNLDIRGTKLPANQEGIVVLGHIITDAGSIDYQLTKFIIDEETYNSVVDE